MSNDRQGSEAQQYTEPWEIPRELGVDDLDTDDLDELCRAINHDAQTQIKATVNSIYVMGSFARGEARDTVSDLDLRVQVEPPVDGDWATVLEQYIKVTLGPELTPEKAGYLDANVTTKEPPENEPAVEVLSA